MCGFGQQQRGGAERGLQTHREQSTTQTTGKDVECCKICKYYVNCMVISYTTCQKEEKINSD